MENELNSKESQFLDSSIKKSFLSDNQNQALKKKNQAKNKQVVVKVQLLQ